MDSLSLIYFLLGAVLFLALAAPGYLLVSRAGQALRERERAREWPVCSAVVSGASLEKKSRNTFRRNIFGGRGQVSVYQPVITYTYTVGGRAYQGSRYRNAWPGEWAAPNPAEAEAVLDGYPPGKTVQVHYDPADPARACLELEPSHAGVQVTRWFGLLLLAAAAVLLAFGVYSLAMGGMARARLAEAGQSPAAVPVPASRIKTALESSLGLACQPESFAGIQVAYRGWNCQAPSYDPATRVEIWSRADAPEKVDLVWAVTDRANAEKNQALLAAVAATALPEADARAAQKWVLETLPSLNQDGSRVETTIQAVPLALQIPSETRLNLLIGASK